MFTDTITLFNHHKPTGKWFPTVLEGVDLQVDSSSKPSTPGTTDDADVVTLLIQSKKDKTVGTTAGVKSYLGPKAYEQCEDPAAHFTFNTGGDFFLEGVWSSLEPVLDDDYDSGFYDEVNKTRDGVYAVKIAAFFGVIPHFEIGGR